MNWIKKITGIKELIEVQKRTNILLEETVYLQKLAIENHCVPYSERRKP